jgi:hypothetical protein
MKQKELENLVENTVRKILKEFDVLRDFAKIPHNGYFVTSDMYDILKVLQDKGIACTSEISRYDHTKSWIRIKREDFKKNLAFIKDYIEDYIK